MSTLSNITTAPRGRRILPATLLIACAVLLAMLAWPMLSGEIYVGDDLGAFHLPLRAFYAEQLAAGESFDWWPQLFGGFFATGEGQLGGYHPMHLALYKYLPLTAAFNLEVFLSYPLMLLGTFCWLRRILRRAGPALFGALVFTFSGFNLLHLFHVNAVAIVAHVPWILLAIDVLWKTENRRGAAWAWLAIAMLTGSQLLLGYPQYVWFSLLTEAGYVLYLWSTSRTPWQSSLTLASGKAVGLLLGGLQLLTTYDALQHSVRSSVESGFAESYSLHPLNLVQLIAPYLFESRVVGQNTHAMGLYAGAVPLMLMAYLFTRRHQLGRLKPIAAAALCLGIFALLMAIGKFGFLYRLQSWLPLVGNFRSPCRMIVLFHLSTAILSAVAMCHLVPGSRRTELDSCNWRPYAFFVGASCAMLPLAMFLWRPHLAAAHFMLMGPLLLTVAAMLVVFASRRAPWALAGLVLFCAADLGIYGMSYSVWQRTAPLDQFTAELETPGSSQSSDITTTRVAQHLPHAKSSLRVGNAITLAGYDRIHGYAGLEPARSLDYRDPRVLQLAGVSLAHRDIFVTDGTIDPDKIETRNNYRPAPFEPLPRFRLVTHVWTSLNPMADLDHLDETSALVEGPLGTGPLGQKLATQTAGLKEPGSVRAIIDRPGRMQLAADAPCEQLLVTTEAYHPGWQIFVDGAKVKSARVNGDFLGGVVPAGKHTVVLIFSPESLAAGRVVSGCGLGLLCVGFVLLRFRRRPISKNTPNSISS